MIRNPKKGRSFRLEVGFRTFRVEGRRLKALGFGEGLRGTENLGSSGLGLRGLAFLGHRVLDSGC